MSVALPKGVPTGAMATLIQGPQERLQPCFQFIPVVTHGITVGGKNPLGPKTDNRTSQTVHKVKYDSYCYEFLINGGFIFVKLSLNQERRLQNL